MPVAINAINLAALAGPIAAFVLVGLAIDIIFIVTEMRGNMLLATILKGVASAVFVAYGIWAYVQRPSVFGVVIVVGLAFGLVGDVLMNARNLVEGDASTKIFVVGVLAFVIGHFLYLAALFMLGVNVLAALAAGALVSAVAIPPFMKNIKAPSAGLRIFGIVYLIIVILMACSATVLAIQTLAPLAWVFMAGAILFMVSDFIMIYYFFGANPRKPHRATNLICYYIGQLLIATSILLI